MTNKSEELFNEIVQLKTQYQAEVSTHRRTWPASIRKRVQELQRLEFSNREISERTGISAKTLYVWLKRLKPAKPPTNPKRESETNAVFLPVKVSRAQGEEPKPASAGAGPGPCLHLPGGMRVDGVTAEFVAQLARQMGGGL